MSNLFKVEEIYQSDGDFHIENSVWDYYSSKESDDKEYGVSINEQYCVVYLNGEMYIDLDKFDLIAENLIKNIKDKVKRKMVILNKKYGVWILLNENYVDNLTNNRDNYISANEYTIKKLLE